MEQIPQPYKQALLEARKMPRDYFLGPSAPSLLQLLLPGLAALVFSVKSRDCKVVGDPERAADHSKTARCLNIVALTLVILISAALILLVATSKDFLFKKVQEVLTEIHDSNFNEPH
ncbi:interferon-induced transmembrane protein 1-like [Sceloporus undulatus]|uniref:interferon-induced transmembrane protein 1-like n=1 Tax=Sceloporus undulatus TaxID=8520 RepID=UPI001C4DBBE6|nr:interferon-induced transmembrane protein 1-like [Sceloporus undulatus]